MVWGNLDSCAKYFDSKRNQMYVYNNAGQVNMMYYDSGRLKGINIAGNTTSKLNFLFF